MNPLMDITKARARYPHGTCARYKLGRCRCARCRKAVRDYQKARDAIRRPPFEIRYSPSGNLWVVRDKKSGVIRHRAKQKDDALDVLESLNASHLPPTVFVSTADVVRHVAALRRAGVGLRTIAEVARVSRGVLTRIVTHEIKRTRRATAQRLLAVSTDAIRSGARVSAEETIVLIERLVSAGYRRGWIARQLGNKMHALQIGKHDWITIERAAALRQLYLRLIVEGSPLAPIPPRPNAITAEPVKLRRRRPADEPITITHPHGTSACYVHNTCRCAPCTDAHATLQHALDSRPLLRYGVRACKTGWNVLDLKPRRIVFSTAQRSQAVRIRDILNSSDDRASSLTDVDAEPARAHVTMLHANGFSDRDIENATGIHRGTVYHIRKHRSRRIRKNTSDALLAFNGSVSPAGNVYVDATDSNRLLDELEAVGFAKGWIATEIGLHSKAFATPRLRMRLRDARKITALYATLYERVAALRALHARAIRRSA